MWWLLLACARSTEPALDDQALAEELRRRLPEHEVRVEPGRLLLVAPDGFERPLYPDALRACRSDCDTARRAWVEEVGQLAAARAEPFQASQLQARLFPQEEAALLGGFQWPAGHGQVAVLVQDTRVVRESELADLDDPRATALLNLRERYEGSPLPWPPETLLVPELWQDPPAFASAADREGLVLAEQREGLREPVFHWTGRAWE